MKVIEWLDKKFEETLIVIFISVFVTASVLQVITRFIPWVNGTWTEEVARYAFIWMTFIGAAVASKCDIHVRVDILETFIKNKKVKHALNFICKAIFLVFILMTAYWGARVCQNFVLHPQKSAVLEINIIWVYAAVPVGMSLTAFRQIQRMWRDCRGHWEEEGEE